MREGICTLHETMLLAFLKSRSFTPMSTYSITAHSCLSLCFRFRFRFMLFRINPHNNFSLLILYFEGIFQLFQDKS